LIEFVPRRTPKRPGIGEYCHLLPGRVEEI